MNVSCPDCRSIFRVDPAKVPPSGVRARCSVCSGVIIIPAPTGQTTPTGGSVRSATPAGEFLPQDRPHSASQAQAGWTSPQVQRTQPAPGVQRQAPPPPSTSRAAEAPPAVRSRPESVERASVMATATPPSPSSGLPEFTPPPPLPPPPPAAPLTPLSAAAPFNPAPAPMSPAAPARPSSGPSAPPFVPSATSSRVAPPSRPSATPTGGSPTVGDTGARRPVNPFLSKDPNQRAKRLARALVSDIITYHPAKHAEGLRDGTLKQLFREEIKKSFEEYIAQVGQQLAESTTYFQEALNEVLGGGKKIF